METNIITYALPIIIPIIVKITVSLVSQIPKWCLPVLASILGAILEVVNTSAAGLPVGATTLTIGGLLGLAGVGVRELIKNFLPKKV